MEYSKEDKERMNALLKSTAEHFNSKNRGVRPDSIRCIYVMPGSDVGCAIGRHLPKRHKAHVLRQKLNDCGVVRLFDTFQEADLGIPMVFRGLDNQFLVALQSLHDERSYWNMSGLTKEGKLKVKSIKKKYKLN